MKKGLEKLIKMIEERPGGFVCLSVACISLPSMLCLASYATYQTAKINIDLSGIMAIPYTIGAIAASKKMGDSIMNFYTKQTQKPLNTSKN